MTAVDAEDVVLKSDVEHGRIIPGITTWRLPGFTILENDRIGRARVIRLKKLHIRGNREVLALFLRKVSQELQCLNSCQRLGDQKMINDMVEEYDMRRQYMLSRLSSINNIDVVEPDGAFYFLVDTTKIGLNSMNLTEKLLSRYLVAAVPGAAFGYDQSLRFSYATSLDVIKKGLDRFEEFCHAH